MTDVSTALAIVSVYGLAASIDLQTRRVPNMLWVVLFVYLFWSGVTLDGVVAALGLAAVGWYGWRSDAIGGADVKGIALLPLALPATWPVALLVGFAGAWVLIEWGDGDAVPLFVPLFAGVVAGAVTA